MADSVAHPMTILVKLINFAIKNALITHTLQKLTVFVMLVITVVKLVLMV